MPRVFVYGTLRRSMRNYLKYFDGFVLNVEKAYVKGLLYTIKGVDYPALVEGNEMILGEIIDLDESIDMKAVDEMEGFIDEGNINNEYHRILMPILDKDGNQIERLPVYFYNLDNPLQKDALDKKIKSNDYVDYMKSKSK